jgi:hypothetical protein
MGRVYTARRVVATKIGKSRSRWGWQILFKEVAYHAQTRLEETLRMWQEIYDDSGALVEVHQKYPTDTGHQRV